MGYFFSFKNSLVECMKEHFRESEIKIYHEFAGGSKKYPLKEKMVCVGYKDLSNCYGSSGYLGESKEGEIFSTNAKVILRLDIFVPVELGGNYCYQVFSQLADFFILNSGRFSGQNIKSGEIKYDSLLEAYSLKAGVEIMTSARYTQNTLGIIEKIIVN